MRITTDKMTSFRPFHPGELLKDELECRNISQKDFAEMIGVAYSKLNEALNAKQPVTAELALMTEAALGVNADLLVRMQADYNMQVARESKTLTARMKKITQIAAML